MSTYLEETKYWGPSNNAFLAIHIFNKYKRRALDLGCGSLRNSKYLSNCGFIVDAIDKDKEVESYANFFRQRPKKIFNLIIADYSEHDLGKSKYDIVVAENTLSFNLRDTIEVVLGKIKKSLKKTGLFAGNLYGLDDYRAHNENMSFYSKSEVRNLLKSVGKILVLEEAHGKLEKNREHWSTYEFVVQKGAGV